MSIDLPFGTWPSPITAEAVAAQSVRLSSVAIDGDDIYWLEGRPSEGGRNVLVRRRMDGTIEDVTPSPFNVRTRVHEYGGGAFLVDRGTVWFSNFADQRVYRMDVTGAPGPGGPGLPLSEGLKADPTAAGRGPQALTPAGEWFYADFCADRSRRRIIAVREDHTVPDREAITTLVGIAEDGRTQLLTGGRDFYSTPRVSSDGTQLAWLCWDHPQMPWDGTELWVASLAADGSLTDARCVAGGPTESIYQPGWRSDGSLVYASDRTGWWQLCQIDRQASADRRVQGDPAYSTGRPLLSNAPARSEFGRPQWVFGGAVWADAGNGTMAVAYASNGVWRLGVVDDAGTLRDLDCGLDPQDWLVATPSHALLIAASPLRAPALVRVSLGDAVVEVIRESSPATFEPGYLSVAEAIEYPTAGGEAAHAFYYPPRNRDAHSTSGRPPVIAISHGGPTAASTRTLDVRIQYWTSRGFAVVDVNYGGSTGFGRRYRERLRGEWGHVDVDDMIHAVTHLVDTGRGDPARLIIRGGSAGGYTTLAALTFHPGVFKAGASYYGVSDLELLARDTHKFEARYLDSLVGPYPEMAGEYRARSPIHATEHLACALIFFQGLEDRVVPPNQSEVMAAAVRQKGLPVAYVAFEGEQHGFRKADTIVRSLEAELYFYAAVFGFVAADVVTPVAIDNL